MTRNGISFDFDFKNFEKNAKNKVLKMVKNQATVPVECPNCQLDFEANNGENTCPHCQSAIDVNLHVEELD